MSNTIYSATGCTRCKIAKQCMAELNIAYEEQDMKAEGKEAFQKFYAANRKAIFRGADGVEFPIFSDGQIIRQGIGPVLAYLNYQEKLNGYFSVGSLHKEWVDGIHISSGNPAFAEEFLQVLRYLKTNNMKLQVDTDGRNSALLEIILNENLADVVIMNVRGPASLYGEIVGGQVEQADLEKSIALVMTAPVYRFRTAVAPILRADGAIEYLTPEETGETAKWLEQVTGSKKLPYFIALAKPSDIQDERLKAAEPMTAEMLFRYRTAARNSQVLVDIEKA